MTASPRWPIFFVLVALALPVAIVFATASAPAAENRDAVAVIIGNKNYPGDIPNVSYALNDAAAMKRFVIDVLGYREGNVIDLTDATKGQMETVFGTAQDYAGQLHDWARGGRSDIVVFYSGHGVPSLRNGRSYLLPVDGDPSRPEISGFPVDVLVDNLSKLGARSVTVYLDACFSGVSDGGVLVQSTSGIGISARMPDAAGVAVLTASQGDQVASWDNEARLGALPSGQPYTKRSRSFRKWPSKVPPANTLPSRIAPSSPSPTGIPRRLPSSPEVRPLPSPAS